MIYLYTILYHINPYYTSSGCGREILLIPSHISQPATRLDDIPTHIRKKLLVCQTLRWVKYDHGIVDWNNSEQPIPDKERQKWTHRTQTWVDHKPAEHRAKHLFHNLRSPNSDHFFVHTLRSPVGELESSTLCVRSWPTNVPFWGSLSESLAVRPVLVYPLKLQIPQPRTPTIGV